MADGSMNETQSRHRGNEIHDDLVRLAVEAGADPERARERMAQAAQALCIDLELAEERGALRATQTLAEVAQLAPSDVVDVHTKPGVCTDCGRDHGEDADRLRGVCVAMLAPAIGVTIVRISEVWSRAGMRIPRALYALSWARALGLVVGRSLAGIVEGAGALGHAGTAACAAACRALELGFEQGMANAEARAAAAAPKTAVN